MDHQEIYEAIRSLVGVCESTESIISTLPQERKIELFEEFLGALTEDLRDFAEKLER